MADQATVYKATYSNVAVYEQICRDIAVMRRRDDGYVNATQILKVAEFAKAQRTRILEREVQTGIHEKIQGGYGKYQGNTGHRKKSTLYLTHLSWWPFRYLDPSRTWQGIGKSIRCIRTLVSSIVVPTWSSKSSLGTETLHCNQL